MAISRNNILLVKDLLEFGADIEHKQRYTNINMPLLAMMEGKVACLNLMLEEGASMDYKVNG